MAERRRRTATQRIGVWSDTANSAQIAGLTDEAVPPEAVIDGGFGLDGQLNSAFLAQGTGHHGVTGKVERAAYRDDRLAGAWRKRSRGLSRR